jgi:hypothetical protein
MGKYYTPKQIASINWKRRWKKRWEQSPEEMESFRVKATKAASLKRHEQKVALQGFLSDWPAALDTATLGRYIKEVIPKGYQPASLVRRLKRLGLIRYREDGECWHNLCHLPKEQ